MLIPFTDEFKEGNTEEESVQYHNLFPVLLNINLILYALRSYNINVFREIYSVIISIYKCGYLRVAPPPNFFFVVYPLRGGGSNSCICLILSLSCLCLVYVLSLSCLCLVYVLPMSWLCLVFALSMSFTCLVYALSMPCLCLFYVLSMSCLYLVNSLSISCLSLVLSSPFNKGIGRFLEKLMSHYE